MDNLIKKGGSPNTETATVYATNNEQIITPATGTLFDSVTVKGVGCNNSQSGEAQNGFTSNVIDTNGYQNVIYAIIFLCYQAASGGTKATHWYIEGSDDNSTWVTVRDGSFTTTASDHRIFMSNYALMPPTYTRYRYYRLRITQSGAGATPTYGGINIVYS